jgi:hypothetical protein
MVYVSMNKLIIPIFVLLFFFSACDFAMPSSSEPVQGTRGVVMNFMRDSLPERVYENDLYYLNLELANEGATDVENGIIALSLDEFSFEIENLEEFNSFSLRGNEGSFQGEQRVQEIHLKTKEITMEGVEAYDTSIKVNMCYGYETLFQDSLCIDTDVRNTQRSKPCQTKSISGSSGQGAPVVVSRVEPRISPGGDGARLSFEIFVQNSGSGTILAEGRGEAVCTSEFDANDFNQVTLKEIRISQYSLSEGSITCETGNPDVSRIDLDNTESITCRVRDDISYSLGTFTTPITIRLAYDYLESIETMVTIEK